MLTSFNDYKNDIFAKRVMALNYINKKNFEKTLADTIRSAICILDNNKKLEVEFDGELILIPYNDILYVKAGLNKKSNIICTKNKQYSVNRPLYSLYEELQPYFCRSHKSYIVNVRQVQSIDSSERTITFKNGVTAQLLSNRLKGKFKSYVRNF